MYYIYHIPGVKIGCTDNIKQRMKKQGFESYEILEQYEDGWYAGDRELILQAEYGYKVDKIHYMQSRQNFNKAKETNIGKPRSIESKINQSIKMKGRTLSEEHIAKITIASTGRKHTEESKNKISTSNKGSTNGNKKQLICSYCQKTFNAGNYKRHQAGNNCKNKI